MPRYRLAGLLVAFMTFATLLGSASADVGAEICAPASSGGEWPMYGNGLENTHEQKAATTISAANVGSLKAAWAFSPVDEGGTGQMQSTPTVAEGCVYVTTSSGYIYALNADTGQLVWKDRISETVEGVCCGGTLFAPAVVDGVVYVNISSNPSTGENQLGPHVIALDSQTGAHIWRSPFVASEEGTYTNSSAKYFDGMIFLGISNPEMGFSYAGGFALVDAATGAVIKRTRTIPEDQRDGGYAGGGIWSTVAIDPVTAYGYAGTAQPSDWTGKESERVNAIVKIDLARARDASGAPADFTATAEAPYFTNPQFAEIVDASKGTPDDPPYIDVDFAGSPSLLRDKEGGQVVAELQKSGWLHAAHTRHMTPAWSRPVSPIGAAIGNYASTATDGKNVFAIGTYPGQIWSIDGTTGIPNWVTPIGTTLGANPLTLANGVLYHADGKGVLNALDADTGVPLFARAMALDGNQQDACLNLGGGAVVARNTVFSVCGDRGTKVSFGPSDELGGWLIAYRVEA